MLWVHRPADGRESLKGSPADADDTRPSGSLKTFSKPPGSPAGRWERDSPVQLADTIQSLVSCVGKWERVGRAVQLMLMMLARAAS